MAADCPMVGRTLAHYRIQEKLGEGGMGVVYRALDDHLQRTVAIKLLPSEAVADPERKRRFVQEARTASALNHPNIITVYDIDTAADVDFIAMEYVSGKTLDQSIAPKGMRLPEALKCAIQIADALAAAHSAGIVHRDLKPGNIMVTEKGLVKVLDFGLAKLAEREVGDQRGPTRSDPAPRTERGTIVGTVAYMSPEQAEGKNVDARSDIFAFGSVLYEMVTGQRAFHGDSRMSTLASILHHEPTPVRELAETTPPELEKIITRCLRKDPDRRIQHMDDVKLALQELKDESEVGVRAVEVGRRKPRAQWVGVAAGLILLAAVAGTALWLRRAPAPVPGKGHLPDRPAEKNWLAGFHARRKDRASASGVQLEFGAFLPRRPLDRLRGSTRGLRRQSPVSRALSRSGGDPFQRLAGRYGWLNLQRPRRVVAGREPRLLHVGAGRVAVSLGAEAGPGHQTPEGSAI